MPTNSGQRRTLSVGTSSRVMYASAQTSQACIHEAWFHRHTLRAFCSSSRNKQAWHGVSARGKCEPEAMWPRRSFPSQVLGHAARTPALRAASAEVWSLRVRMLHVGRLHHGSTANTPQCCPPSSAGDPLQHACWYNSGRSR
eukprot:scaffold4412_cov71-Phaeocystis_antarctica.AAC.4